MSNTIIELKHSQVSGNTPSVLANGEISINTNDGKIFYKHPNGSILAMERYTGPSGLDGELQFNDSGDLGASSNLTFNKTTGILTVGGGLTVGSLNVVPTVNSLFNHANAAFEKANTGNTLAQAAYDKANSTPITNSFSTIVVPGESSLVANSNTSSLTLIAGSGLSITTNASTQSITISAQIEAASLFVDGADFGTTLGEVVDSNDLGSIIDVASSSLNLGGLTISGILTPSTLILPSYTVATLPNANPAAQMVFVSDEAGGAVIAFSDGTNWRRMTDRQIVS